MPPAVLAAVTQPTPQEFIQALSPFIMLPLMAGGITMVLVPIFARWATKLGIIDKPDERKRHGRTVPYSGGIGMLVGWIVAMLFYRDHYSNQTWRLGGIVISCIFIALVGLYDDTFKMRPKYKFFAQIAVALFLFYCGVGTLAGKELLVAVGVEPHYQPDWIVFAISLPFVLFVIVGACNAANLIDGLDGLCSGVTSIMSAGMVVMAVHISLTLQESAGLGSLRLALALALLGVTIGFLSYNSPPARVFMGDAGSLFIGLNAGILMILLLEVSAKWFIGAAMCFGLPIFDTALAIYRRLRMGKSIFSPDNWHMHHLLIRRGLTVQRATWVMYLLSLTFTLAGMAVIVMPLRYAIILISAFTANFLTMAILMGMGSGDASSVQLIKPPQPELPPMPQPPPEPPSGQSN